MNQALSAEALPFALPHYMDAQLNEDPFPYYDTLRRETPICRTTDNLFRGRQGYLLTRYDDVRLALTDNRFSSDPKNETAPSLVQGLMNLMQQMQMFRLLTDSMVFKDDPDHRRLRGLVNQAFTNRAVQTLENNVAAIVNGLFDQLASKGTVDFVEEFSVPLPLAVISEMLGVQAKDRDNFYAWMKRFSEATTGSPVQLVKALPTGYRMIAMFRRLVEERRANPDDKLISGIVTARFEGEQLDDHEVLGMIFLLLLAGHDTTANLINMSALMFIEHPEQLERLREDPALIDSAVEELLRYTAPVVSVTPRIPLEDLEISGVRIAKGTPVLPMIISANRDETVFPNAGELDFGWNPNPHFGFGYGGHICLGLMLARLEARIALLTLAQRFREIELAVPRDELQYKQATLRGLTSLPLRLRE